MLNLHNDRGQRLADHLRKQGGKETEAGKFEFSDTEALHHAFGTATQAFGQPIGLRMSIIARPSAGLPYVRIYTGA